MITFSALGKQGQLGNQLFQIGAVISHALRTGDDYILPKWEYEKDFCIDSSKFSDHIKPGPPYLEPRVYVEPHFHYAEIPKARDNNELLNLSGYFQSWRYLDFLLRGFLTPRYSVDFDDCYSPKHNPEFGDGLCAIHIRRTDYLKFPDAHPFPGMEYYERAMSESKCRSFMIFSDDISWCKENFIGNRFDFSEGMTNVQDLAIMSRCQDKIIANSSFSWWAAWLDRFSGIEDRHVFYPARWFGPALANHNTNDLCPPEWIRL